MKKTKKIFLVILTVVIVAIFAVIPSFAYDISLSYDGLASTLIVDVDASDFNEDHYFTDYVGSVGNTNLPLVSNIDTYYDVIDYTVNWSVSGPSDTNPTVYFFMIDSNKNIYTDKYNSTPIDSSRSIYVREPGDSVAFRFTNRSIDSSDLFCYADTDLTRLQNTYDFITMSDSVKIGTFIKDSISAGFDIVDDFGAGIKNAFNSVFFKTDPSTGAIIGVSYLGITSFVFIGIAIITGICMLVFRKLFRRT